MRGSTFQEAWIYLRLGLSKLDFRVPPGYKPVSYCNPAQDKLVCHLSNHDVVIELQPARYLRR